MDISAEFNGQYYGVFVSTILCGVTIVQAWIYGNDNKDRWHLRLLVAVLVAMDLATTFVNMQYLHHYAVKNFGNFEALLQLSPLMTVEIDLSILSMAMVQVFFASRVYLLKRVHWIVPLMIASFGLAALVPLGLVSAEAVRNPTFGVFLTTKVKHQLTALQILQSTSDVILTVCLSWSFTNAKTGFERTDTLLQKLLQYTVTRGLLMTLFHITMLVVYLAQTDSFNWAPFHFCSSKLYIISMIAMLNARPKLRREHTGSIMSSDHGPFHVGSVSAHFSPTAHAMDMLPSPSSEGQDEAYAYKGKPPRDSGIPKVFISQERDVVSDV